MKITPFWKNSNLMQIYGKFEGFPENNSALFRLVIFHDVQKRVFARIEGTRFFSGR